MILPFQNILTIYAVIIYILYFPYFIFIVFFSFKPLMENKKIRGAFFIFRNKVGTSFFYFIGYLSLISIFSYILDMYIQCVYFTDVFYSNYV
jgi:hypothetical protein